MSGNGQKVWVLTHGLRDDGGCEILGVYASLEAATAAAKQEAGLDDWRGWKEAPAEGRFLMVGGNHYIAADDWKVEVEA